MKFWDNTEQTKEFLSVSVSFDSGFQICRSDHSSIFNVAHCKVSILSVENRNLGRKDTTRIKKRSNYKNQKKKTTEHTISRRIPPVNMHQIGSQIQAGKNKREESEKQKMLTNSSPNPRDAPWTNATPGAVACCALPPSTDAAVRTTPVWKKLEHKLLRDTISDDILGRNAREKQALTHLEHTTAAIAIAIARAAVSLCASLFSRTLFCLSPRREPDETEGQDPFPTNDSVHPLQSSLLVLHIVFKVRWRVFLFQNFVICSYVATMAIIHKRN